MKKLLALFMCLTIIASCASVSVCAAEIENLAGGPFNFEDVDDTTADITPFTNAKVVDKTAAGVDFVAANGNKVLKLSGSSDIKFSDAGINSGIIEFTTDWYACNTKTNAEGTAVAGYGLQFSIASSDNSLLPILKITKEEKGSLASACGGWSSNGMLPGKWWTMKITINVDGDNSWYEVAYKEPGTEDSTYTNILLQHVELDSPQYPNTLVSYVKRFVFDGKDNSAVKKENNNQKMLSNVNRISFRSVGSVDYDLFDNTRVKVYEPLYTAINNCKTADEVKTQLKLYKNLGIFDFGSEYTMVDDMNTVFSALIGQSFGSDAAVTNAYNAAVAANVNPYISERYVMDDITENTIFAGKLISDSEVDGGKFFKPTYSNSNLNFKNKYTDGIVKFNSDVYVNYRYDNASAGIKRITPFGISAFGDTANVTIASINRGGSFATASAAWGGNPIGTKKWTNIEYLLNIEDKSLRIRHNGNNVILPTSYSDYTSNTIANSYIYKYTGEKGSNSMGTLPDTINGLKYLPNIEQGGGADSLDYMRNTDITVYKPLYQVINESTDAESFEKAIDFYSSNLNVFTKSDKAYSAEDLYTDLGGKTYNNSKEFVDAYNKYVSALSLNPGVIGYNDKKTSINYISVEVNTTNVTVKKDDISYVALYAADGSLNGVYELPRITSEKTAGDGQRTYTYGDGITLVNWDAAITGETVVISKYNWDEAATAKVFIWSKDSDGSAIIPVANSVKIK